MSGAVSYTQVYRFDYSKDGHRNPVRFYIEFKARPAVGTEGQPGYVAESGSIHYYVFDIEKNQRVEKWLEGFAMLNHDAVAADHPATNIVIKGNTATFEAFTPTMPDQGVETSYYVNLRGPAWRRLGMTTK